LSNKKKKKKNKNKPNGYFSSPKKYKGVWLEAKKTIIKARRGRGRPLFWRLLLILALLAAFNGKRGRSRKKKRRNHLTKWRARQGSLEKGGSVR